MLNRRILCTTENFAYSMRIHFVSKLQRFLYLVVKQPTTVIETVASDNKCRKHDHCIAKRCQRYCCAEIVCNYVIQSA